jgi:carbon-monoxide dehydrogenase large subunit
MVYDAQGQQLSATFADYLLPTACEVQAIELIAMHTPNRHTPAGIKGMAEGGVMGATGAIGNAVNDALAPLGVVAEAQPFSPDRLRRLLRKQP